MKEDMDLDFVKPKRALVEIDAVYIDGDLFNNPLDFVIKSLQEKQAKLKEKYPTATEIKLKTWLADDAEISVYVPESDIAYENRVQQEYQQAVRKQEIATLKRLRSKYPNVTFE